MLSLNQLYDFYLLLVFAQQRVSPYDHEGRKNGCFSLYEAVADLHVGIGDNNEISAISLESVSFRVRISNRHSDIILKNVFI